MAITYPFKFKWTRDLEKAFEQVPVFLKHHNKIAGVIPVGRIVTIGRRVLVEPFATLPGAEFMSVSAFSYCRSYLGHSTTVGRYCSIAPGVAKLDIDHPLDRITTHVMSFREYWTNDIGRRLGGCPEPVDFPGADKGPVTIGNDVWIGQNVSIRRGIKIGDGAVIASGSVVVKDVEPFSVVGGVSARHIKHRLTPGERRRALATKWWRFAPQQFAHLPTAHPGKFLDGIERMIDEGIEPWSPKRIDLAEFVQAKLANLSSSLNEVS